MAPPFKSSLYRELELARLANATPPAEQALRDRLAREPSARTLPWLLLWALIGVLLLALVAGIYAGTGRYQAWQAYQSRPDPLAGLSPRDLQDKELSALMLLASDHFLHGRYRQAIALWQQLLDEERPRINRAALIEAIQTARMMGG